MMDSSSFFGNTSDLFSQAEPINVSGATCNCYRVRLYGRLHFLKRLKEELRTDPRYVAAMDKEFETGYILDHPNIVKYFSKGEDYILMEYVDGEQLSDFMTNHPDYFTTKAHVDRFLFQLLAAVDCLHQHGIVHLDLKPQNILITRVGQNVKLADLGFCYADAYPDTMGRTDRFAAPEQFDTHQLPDERTDIYAIGRIIEQFPCANKYNKVIERCLSLQPERRYQSIQELQSALQPKSRHWGIIIATCFVILLAISSLFWSRTSISIPESRQSDSIVESPKSDSIEKPMPSDNTAVPHTIVSTGTPALPAVKTEPSSSHAKKMSDTELRKRLQSIAQPIYESTLGQLQNMPYHGNERLFSQMGENFDQQLRERFHPLCEQLEKSGAVSQRTFMTEWSNLRLDYHNSTYDKMLLNEEKQTDMTN